jgi:hypothetical protein
VLYVRAASRRYRSGHSRTKPQLGIGGVDYRVNIALVGYVASTYLYYHTRSVYHQNKKGGSGAIRLVTEAWLKIEGL